MTLRTLPLALSAIALISTAALAQEAKKEAAPAPAAPAAAPAPVAAPAPTPAPAPAEAASAPTATPAPAPAPKAETEAFGRIYVYREKRFMGAALHHDIYLDGKLVAEIGNGSFFILKVAPGAHKLRGEEPKEEITVTVEAGKTYYCRTEIMTGFMSGHGKVNPIEEAVGAKEFKEWTPKLKYATNLKVPEVFEKL